MTAMSSRLVFAPPRLVMSFTVLLSLCICILALRNVVADRTPPGNSSHFTEFGERCSGERCRFDEGTVGNDVSRFCLTQQAGGGRAVQLVKPGANHLSLELIDEGLKLLRSFPKPLAIVAATGGIKTGKSFFLNVLNEHVICGNGDSLNGFHVADTVSATTQGIWIWSKPIEVSCKDLKSQLDGAASDDTYFGHLVTKVESLLGGTLKATVTAQERIDIGTCAVDKVHLILLDVEGFNSTDGFQRYDDALFTIASTLSTELIYLTHKVVDARDVIDLQHMIQTASSTLVNVYRSLSYAPHVVTDEGSTGNDYDGVSVVTQVQGTGGGVSGKGEPAIPSAPMEGSHEIFLEHQQNTNLTISVQGFNLQLQQSALEYINGIVNNKRYDLTYEDSISYFEYFGQLRTKFIQFVRNESTHKGTAGGAEEVIDNLLSSITSGHKYVIPHVFGSIDVLLASSPSMGKGTTLLKSNLVTGYLEQIRKYKWRLFKRSVMRPKDRYSPVKDCMVLMSGDDLCDLLVHLVSSLNESMKSGAMDSLGANSASRINIIKRDLIDLYAGDLYGFVHRQPIPLKEELESFSKVVARKYIQLLSVYGEYDLASEQFGSLKSEFSNLLGKTLDHFTHELHETTTAYCRSKLQSVKDSIRTRIGNFKLPILPGVIKEFEGSKDELLGLYASAVDDSGIRYSGSVACSEISKEVLDFVNEVIDDLHKDNEKEISMLFQEATRCAVEIFISKADRNSVDIYRVKHDEFLGTLKSWVGSAYNAYYELIGEFKSLDKYNKVALSFLNKQISLFEKEARDHWHDICREAIMHISHKFKTTFDTQLLKLVPYRPAPTSVLSMAVEYLRACGWCEMEALYCSSAEMFRESRQNFDRMVDELGAKAKSDNYEAIFSHFNKGFNMLHKEAVERVEDVYHFYQLKRHIHRYASYNIFQMSADFERVLKPQRNLDELIKNMKAEVVKGMPKSKVTQDLLALHKSGESPNLKRFGTDLDTLRDDIIEKWLEVKLYPKIRSRLMIRMPALSTFLAMMGICVSSVLLMSVRDSRVLHFLYCLNVVFLVHLVGPRRAYILLGKGGNYLWRLLVIVSKWLGPMWTYVIVISIVAVVSLWYLLFYRLPSVLRRRRTKAVFIEDDQ